MAEDNANIYGTWKIVECVSPTGVVEKTGIEGTEFTLDESGDVTWKIPEETEIMAFFNCETFEVFHGKPPILKFFGTYTGHTIEFRVEVSDDLMLLTYEHWCMLQCHRIASNDSHSDFPFSFLGALEEGYFSDISIIADNGKEFKIHKTILSLSNSGMDWTSQPPPLTGLPEDVLATILHYLYSECLPPNLTEDTARHTLRIVSRYPGFTRLAELCDIFLKNTALKQQIISLVTEMHACANRIIDYFSGKAVVTDANSSPPGGAENLGNNPAKLCYVVKQGLRETAVAGVKLLILCDLFSKRKHELAREERHDIIKYAMSRLPVFMNQLHRFLDVIRQTVGDLTSSQRHEIATYLVPEIESTLDLLSDFVTETKSALEHIINSSNPGDRAGQAERSKKVVGEVLSRSLKNALHMRELRKLKHFNEKISMSFTNLIQKKESFNDMTSANKVRSVANNLGHLDEIPMFLLRLEELMSALHEKLTWKEWKYFFKLGTSKVAWVLQKLVSHRGKLRTIILQMCDMVQRDQFTQSLTILGLLDPAQVQESAPSNNSSKLSQSSKSPIVKLNLVESLSIPPLSRDSTLAKNAIRLLETSKDTDMVFEIVCIQDATDTIIDHTDGEPVDHSTREQDVEIHEIRAHCVIIASRCDWFRRALLSGMRESIDKKIVVHDTNPALFRIFLEYLYEGQLEMSKFSTEQLADLMLLSDRYEVETLKQLCEHALKDHVDEDSALFLLGIADQFSVKSLREAALDFISMNPDVIQSEVFYELPEDIQSEVEDMIAWLEPTKAHKVETCPQFPGQETPSPVSSSLGEVEEMITNMHISSREQTEPSDSSSLEDLPLTQDSARLEACVAQLRDIVGENVPREELVRISLAADYDTNRALNFFFTS